MFGGVTWSLAFHDCALRCACFGVCVCFNGALPAVQWSGVSRTSYNEVSVLLLYPHGVHTAVDCLAVFRCYSRTLCRGGHEWF